MKITLGAELVSIRLAAGHRCAPKKQPVLRVGAFFIELKITKDGMTAHFWRRPVVQLAVCVCLGVEVLGDTRH